MKSVLFLSYYFPPLGGAGVQRTVKFAKYLPALGWEATVVTGPSSSTVAWAPPDETLAHDVPPGTQVRPIATLPPPTGAPRHRRLQRWLRLQGGFARWWVEGATQAGLGAVEDADVIVASMSPFETAEVASRLAAVSGVPWIADLRDPWALDEWVAYPTGIHRRLEEHRMRRLLRGADGIVVNTPEAEHILLARFPELAGRVVATIPNGWDAEDFAGPPPARRDEAFRIVYSGYAHTVPRRRRGLRGGSTPGLDTSARSHLYLVEALERLAEREPRLCERIELHLAGPAPIDEGSGRVRIVLHGYVSHGEAVRLVRSADLLFLPMHDLPPGVRARAVPGKTYEYLAAGRPILAALPDGDARDLLSGLERVRVCRPRDVGCLEHAIEQEVRAPLESEAAATAELVRYERRTLAADLARVLEEVAALGVRRRDPVT